MSDCEKPLAARRKVSAVLFDYGLVLTGPPHPPAWEEMKATLGATEEDFHTAYWRHRHEYDCGVLDAPQYWKAVAQDVGQQVEEPQLNLLLEADTALWTQPNPPMIAWAAALQQAGVRTGILSNLGDGMEVGVMRSCGWMGGFAHHTFSHRLGIAKPQAAIYEHAAAGLGVPAAEVLFIDDREDNVAGALSAGMQALRYGEHGDFVREFHARGYGENLPAPAVV